MEKIIISSDSTCDLSEELKQQNDIRIIPLSVHLGDESYKDNGTDITPGQIIEFVERTGTLPRTSAPNTEDYTEYFTKFLEEADCVLHFDISSKASASYENACRAAKQFEGRVYVVDSEALSTGQGLLIMKACDLRAAGKSAHAIYDHVNLLRPKVNTSFIPDTLLYLYKGGRCSTLSYYGAKVLSIHPMIDMKEGQLYPKRKYMGNMQRCLKRYVADLSQTYTAYDSTRCFVTHSNADPELVQKVIDMVKETFAFREIIETQAGSIVTCHCGKGTIGVLFISE